MLDSVIGAGEVASIDIYPRIALESTCEELLACVAMLERRPDHENIVFATIARDRLLRLVLHHGAEDARRLFDSGSALVRLLASPRLVDALLKLPAPTSAMQLPRLEQLPGDPRWLALNVLSGPPHEFDQLVDWLADFRYAPILMHYATSRPKCFDSDTERVRYYTHATRLCALCADILERNAEASLKQLAVHAVETLSSGVIYSCEGTLREFAEAKGRLITNFLRISFPDLVQVDMGPPRTAGDRPIRLALLWNDVDTRTENLVGVASARHLRSYGFEVVSILHHHSYHGIMADQPTIEDDLRSFSDEIVDLNDLPKLADKTSAIRALDLDCLIFMNNVTFGYNEYVALAALRLARTQAVNFCAVCTTGLQTVDLYFSGDMSERGEDPANGYTERLIRLPGTCLVFDKADTARYMRPRGLAAALRDSGTQTLFASGANLYKIHPALSEVWARVLKAAPGSRLALYPFNPNWDLSYPIDKFAKRFTSQLLAIDVDPERVTIGGPWRDASAVEEVLAAADVYLDSFPHSGGLSSLDALKLGIPVVTIRGQTQRENQTADLLDLLGLSRFVTASRRDYVALAGSLAADPERWAEYSIAIIRAMGGAAFFDTNDYSRKFAASLKQALIDG